MADQKPSVGRIVLYSPPAGYVRPHKDLKEFASVIIQLHDDGSDTVVLEVFEPGKLQRRQEWGVAKGQPGQLPQGSWRWPPRLE